MTEGQKFNRRFSKLDRIITYLSKQEQDAETVCYARASTNFRLGEANTRLAGVKAAIIEIGRAKDRLFQEQRENR